MRKLMLITAMIAAGYTSAYAQQKKKVPIKCDTVAAGSWICPGQNVIQFRMTVISPSHVITREITVQGPCYGETRQYQAGTVIYFEEIISSPGPGILVRLPARKYYLV